MAADPTARTVCVTNTFAGTVSVIDEATGTVTRTIPVGSISEVAVDPTTRTANTYSGTVSVIDEATGTVTRTIPVRSGPAGVAVDPAARTAYVANSNSGTVSVIQMCGCHRRR